MRRAMRNARLIGQEEPYLYKLAGFVAELMRPAYPEMMESVQRVARVVKDEEHRYATTFLVAEKVFQSEVKNLTDGVLPGTVSFKLYDTYGLALDEQEEMARERGLSLDHEGFMSEMRTQRERARASWKGAEKGAIAPAYQELVLKGRTKFLGYESLCATSCVVGLLVNQQLVDSIGPDTAAELVLDHTPFYAETGGQVGDRGTLASTATGDTVATVESAYPAVPGLTVHRIKSTAAIHVGDNLRADVSESDRRATERNHTATHLLHAALRQVLGTHVKQAGSVVEPPRLRFDFAHYTAMDQAEIEEVERLVNENILNNAGVVTDVMPLDKAISTGAMALFGEKYGDEVRVVQVPDFSKELCGGTHVKRTGDIGVFKIVSEGSISAGVRRIEAVTGEGGLRQFQNATESLHRIAQMFRTSEPEIFEQIERTFAEKKALERQVESLKQEAAQAAAGSLENRAQVVNGSKVLAARVDGMDRAQLRSLVDSLRNKWKSAVVVLTSVSAGEVAIVAGVTKDLTGKVQAGKLVGTVAQATGGKGGGRPDMAEGGGKDPSRLAEALENISKEVSQKL
jgi:alanyl-tRNA synthetase